MSSTFVPAAKRYHGILKQQGEGCSPEEIAVEWAQLTVAGPQTLLNRMSRP